ncbi:MAG TPA: serine hydrolase domain-containing protein, partial [Thermomicrobiaceae bacterium]|nr:serine hydrolase domain-containing protein [Thermomicrobiaceae bacterium]
MAQRRDEVSDETGRLAPVFERVAGFVTRGEVAGAGLAVALGGRVVAEGYWGLARPERPAGPEILWPLASTSKLYTAATVMALVERGELTLAQPVSRVLPELAGEGREAITLRQLLTHTSGLIYESPEMEQVLLGHTPLDGILDEAYRHPLLFPPGTGYSYSDFGIGLAGRLAARAAGRPFPELVRALVLEPAGLEQTFMPPPPEEYPRVASVAGVFAFGTDAAMYNSPYALALAHPAFGAVASVRDLLRFGLLFAPTPGGDRRIFSSATIRTMTSDQTGGVARDHASGLRR